MASKKSTDVSTFLDIGNENQQDAAARLQFQDFGTTNLMDEKEVSPYEQTHTFSKFPHSQVDLDDEKDFEASGAEAEASDKTTPSMWTWGFYQRYFDVDTVQVRERLIWSMIPWPSRDFLTHHIKPTPDLYGPFWICATLVFCIAIMGNIADYLQSGGEGKHWRYDFRKVSISASTIFSYALILPLMLWMFMWWRKKQGEQIPLNFVELVSLYGYSLAIYIPVSILWTIPFPWLQWTFVVAAAALSGSVLLIALWQPISTTKKGVAVLIITGILVCHLLLAAGLQLYFFRYDSGIKNNRSVIIVNHQEANNSKPLQSLSLKLEGGTELTHLKPADNFNNASKTSGKIPTLATDSEQKILNSDTVLNETSAVGSVKTVVISSSAQTVVPMTTVKQLS
nr:EOG090X0CJ3 [Cyclestheria hislopi]